MKDKNMMNTQNNYENKLFSVLGDSISTLSGYTEPSDAAFYDGARKFEADVYLPEDTWWGQVIERLGGTLLVNNSFSGSTVVKRGTYFIPSYGCSSERTADLKQYGRMPDVVMVFMGINDWGCGVHPVPENEAGENDLSVFSVAYGSMLQKLRRNYPRAEIWCLTLPVSICRRRENFTFPYRYGGRHIEEYCEVIRTSAEAYGCRVIDLYRSATPYDTIDGFHPNADGMKTLADAVLRLIDSEVP